MAVLGRALCIGGNELESSPVLENRGRAAHRKTGLNRQNRKCSPHLQTDGFLISQNLECGTSCMLPRGEELTSEPSRAGSHWRQFLSLLRTFSKQCKFSPAGCYGPSGSVMMKGGPRRAWGWKVTITCSLKQSLWTPSSAFFIVASATFSEAQEDLFTGKPGNSSILLEIVFPFNRSLGSTVLKPTKILFYLQDLHWLKFYIYCIFIVS